MMKKSMTLFGCGPKLGLLCLPYVFLSLAIIFKYPEFLDLGFINTGIVKVTGFIWLVAGIIFWLYSAIFFLKRFRPGELINDGPFGLCRNPIYSSIIVFIVPALGIIFHSGLILSISLVLFIGFKISIHGEANVLKRIFGEEYELYEKTVNEIFPFPRYLFRSKVDKR